MNNSLRNPRYLLPLGVLIAVTIVSLALAQATTPDGGSQPQVAAPTAATVPTAATESPADAARAADLATIADALATYKSRNATYPTTQQYFATLCQLAFDAGCLLTTVSKDLPVTDGTTPYWYRSDGQSYTLFAAADAGSDPDTCPAETPPALAGKPLICLSSAGGGN